MTLILTLATPSYAEQVADRLVSQGEAKWDPASNKTVVFLASDGIGILSYAGAAHLGPRHTDEVVASAIACVRLDNEPFAVRIGPHPLPDIGLAMRLACQAIAVSADAANIQEDHLQPSLVLTGWKWRRRPNQWVGIRPILWSAARRANHGNYHVTRLDLSRVDHRLSAWPPGWLSADGRGALAGEIERLRDAMPNIARGLMAMAIAGVSMDHPNKVGPDLIAARITSPAVSRQVEIAYLGTPSPSGTYLPWLIGLGNIVAPSVLTPGWSTSLGPFSVAISGPAVPQRPDVIMDSQRRRPIPRRWR